MKQSTRLLRWLAPSIRQERDEWTALHSKSQLSEKIDPDDRKFLKLQSQYRELVLQNQGFKISAPQQTLTQIQARVGVILQRCRLYLDAKPSHPLCQEQLPILKRILDLIQEEQQYIRSQLLLTQTSLHYLKQLQEASQEIWTKPFCNPNYLLNLLRKIEIDDVYLNHPGEFLFVSLKDFIAVANFESQDTDFAVYARGLETARLINFVSVQHKEWQENRDLLLLAGLLHDFGWMMLNQEESDGAADDSVSLDEWAQHPLVGAALLGGLRGFSGDSYLSEVVSQHHERLDGTGFPRRLHTHALSEHSRRFAVISRYLELKNSRQELTGGGLRTYDVEEITFAAALQLYREMKRGEWDETAVTQTLSALDPELQEELRLSDRKNDLFSLKRYQQYRRDEAHSHAMRPHILPSASSTQTRSLTDS